METLSDLGTGAHGRFRANVEGELADTFTVLSDGSTVNWNCLHKKLPMGKLTSSQSFTIDMTNVMDGAQGVLELITNTGSAITITFDTSFTNKSFNTTLTTYTFAALTAQRYFLSFVVDGTTIEWVISSTLASVGTLPFARVTRAASQSVNNNTATALSFDTETEDASGMYSAGNPTRLTIQGSGNKIAHVTCMASFAFDVDGIRRVAIYKNGTLQNVAAGGAAIVTMPTNTSTSAEVVLSTLVACAAGDYLEMFVTHVAGAALNVTGALMIHVFDRA